MPIESNHRSSDSLTERIVRVIEAVVDADAPAGPRGLARSMGMDRSTVGRILRQLDDLDVFDRRDGGYVPGPRLFGLSRVLGARDNLPLAIGPTLGALVDRFDETCYVCSFHGDVAVFTHEIQSSKPLRFVVELGRPVPLHAGAAGRAILAGLDADHIRQVLGEGPLPSLTSTTITDVETLVAMAATDRLRGYSVSTGERIAGGASVASPFFDQMRRCLGSVVFTAPLGRIETSGIEEIGEAVAAAARSLSDRLMGRGDG